MEIFLAFIAFLIFFLGMALGLIFKGQPLKGSCGGVAALMGNESCEICGGNPNKCEEYQQEQQEKASTELAYDAMEQRKD